ncbi:hypothetical protein [Maioricimonas sp. JC845]
MRDLAERPIKSAGLQQGDGCEYSEQSDTRQRGCEQCGGKIREENADRR